MRKIRAFYYILRQGVANSFKNWHMLFSSVFVIFVSLYIMGCLMLLSVNLQSIVSNISDRQKEVVVDCTTDISDEASLAIADIIIKDDRVSKEKNSVIRISKEENLQKAVEMFEDEQDLFENFNADYMYVSFRVKLVSSDYAESFSEDMKKIAGIEEVTDNTSVYKYFSSINHWIKIGSIAAMAVFGFLSIMLSANTIRLTVFARNKELHIMKNIGASSAFMRGPFVVEGIIIGIISSLLSYFAVRLTYSYIYDYIQNASDDLKDMLDIVGFREYATAILLCFIAAGTIIGVVSSGFAIRRYIKI